MIKTDFLARSARCSCTARPSRGARPAGPSGASRPRVHPCLVRAAELRQVSVILPKRFFRCLSITDCVDQHDGDSKKHERTALLQVRIEPSAGGGGQSEARLAKIAKSAAAPERGRKRA